MEYMPAILLSGSETQKHRDRQTCTHRRRQTHTQSQTHTYTYTKRKAINVTWQQSACLPYVGSMDSIAKINTHTHTTHTHYKIKRKKW